MVADPTAPARFRSRIVGSGTEDPTQLLANPRNWREHPGAQRRALVGSLDTVGWVQQVIVNTTTGHLVDGHARIEEAISAGESSVPVLYVELSEAEEALVLATLDPIGAMANTNQERLGELLSEVSVDDAGLAALLDRIRPADGDAYTKAVNLPIYEPTAEEPPAETELYDEGKAEELRAAIRAADLPEPVRDFLLAATWRHVEFSYSKIAEYYAHAPAEVQRLMEASALVIVDVDDGVRHGYVHFMESIMELEAEDRVWTPPPRRSADA